MSITIRQAAVGDLDKLSNIEKSCFRVEAFTREQIAYLLKSPEGVSLVAQTDREIVGFVLSLIYRFNRTKVGHIFTLEVLVEHRRKGVASMLLDELERKLIKKDVRTCFLEVRADNVAARRLYRKHAYTATEQLKHYYGKRIDALRMMKRLERVRGKGN
jgi:ribosomal-protein-alanine N-acetyltransferase